ncbi:MAG: septum formation initiator family protein [Flavobacteriaceae bacterium]|nr:septum formation initiator family protein [Flavobacteriaceae bacterium]MDG2447557.1 septum formation initiator family protein [Flavobacteriaceae bacterium]
MKLISKIKNNKWIRIIGNKYLIITVFFVFWMLFFDTNSFLIHKELNDDIKKLEENKKAYLEEIINDKIFIDKMKDSVEIEKFAREQYYLKKENEEIYLIEHEDSVKTKNK